MEHAHVRDGSAEIGARFSALSAENVGLTVVDAVDDRDLDEIGRACAGLELVTVVSGLALGLAQNFPELKHGREISIRATPTMYPPVPIENSFNSKSLKRAMISPINEIHFT